jgi:hypothetical protein
MGVKGSWTSKVAELEGTIEALTAINTELEKEVQRGIADLAAANRQLDAQGASYQEYLGLKADRDVLAVFMRTNYRLEIMAGEHAALTLTAGVIRYLARERARWTVKLRYWWWGLTNKEEED